MSSNDARLLPIIERILETGESPEDACDEFPELLPEVRQRLEAMSALDAEIDTAFPSHLASSGMWSDFLKRLSCKHPTIEGYTVEGIIGTGGVGVVYRARHIRLNRLVAIKMLLAGGYAGPRELERFKREAESVASLCHPNIVQLFDAGECEGHPYFTMEFVEGGTLATHLAGHPQSAVTAALWTATLARAVEAAHARGIVHRDLKPGNVLRSADGILKIADFGLAKSSVAEDDGHSLTYAGTPVGTPSYMSPEQTRGDAGACCPQVDIYALGAILYELLTGRPPFRGENQAETQRLVLNDEPVPPSRLNPRTPEDLQTICLKCLLKESHNRYQTAADLADDLDRFLKNEPIHARPISPALRAFKWIRRRPAIATMWGVLFVVFATSVGVAAKLRSIEVERRMNTEIREIDARNAVGAAITAIESLIESGRWTEAENIASNAMTRLSEANSADLDARLCEATANFRVAHELDRIRQNYPEPGVQGYNYKPAAVAYASLFAQVGLGPEVPSQVAARRVRASAIRSQLLVALDNAAFVSRILSEKEQEDRLLEIARSADPDSWRDRFRSSQAWRNQDTLLSLVAEIRSSGITVPPHELVIIGVLLNGLGANAQTVEILREAQHSNPSDFWVNLELGNALDRAGRRSESIQFYRAAIAIKPDNFVVWTILGAMQSLQGDAEDAVRSLRKALDLNPRFVSGWQILILTLGNAGKWDEAAIAYKKAFTISPGDLRLQYANQVQTLTHARYCAARQEWRAACDLYKMVTSEMPEEGEPWFEYAAVLLLDGDTAGYRRTREHMLERCTMGSMRKFLVVRAYTLAPGTADELTSPVTLGNQELNGWATQHWSLMEQGAIACRLGRPIDAIPLFQRSIQAQPATGDAIVNWAWLAVAHSALGELDQSQEWLAKVSNWIANIGATKPDGKVIHLHNWLEAIVIKRELDASLRLLPTDTKK